MDGIASIGSRWSYNNDNNIFNNTCLNNNRNGIYLVYSENIIIEHNSCNGIILEDSLMINFSYNTMLYDGLSIIGDSLSEWIHNIDDNNTANGKKVTYIKNKNGGTFSSIDGQFLLANCSNVIVENNDVKNIRTGLALGFSNNNIIKNNNFSNNIDSIRLQVSKSNIIEKNTCRNSNNAITLEISDLNTVDNNYVSNNMNSINVQESSTNIISNNTCSFNRADGIYISEGSTHNEIKNNICNNNNMSGILIYSTRSRFALYGGYNIIKENECKLNNISGIHISNSNNNTILKNNCSQNVKNGIQINGDVLAPPWLGSENIFNDNDCNYNQQNGIYFHNGTFNSIGNNNIKMNVMYGINLDYGSMKNTLSSNKIKENLDGIHLFYSENCKIIDNICNSNKNNNIYIRNSSSTIIVGNNISKGLIGLHIYSNSDSNIVYENTISHNMDTGLLLDLDCNTNRIYYNNIISNSKQAEEKNSSPNYWNNNLDEGNYWSDYLGVDTGAAGRIKGDGIGDTQIPHLNLDFYPFTEESGWIYPGIPNLIDPGDLNNDGTFTISWTETRNTLGYILQESMDETFESRNVIYKGSDLNLDVVDHLEGTFFFRVKTYIDDYQSDWSNIVDITINYPPKKPQGLNVDVDPVGNTLNISWDPLKGDVENYHLFYKRNETSSWDLLAILPHPGTEYKHKGLVNGEPYFYRLKANDSLGLFSGFSVEMSGIPWDSLAPSSPLGFLINDVTPYSITLKWNSSKESDLVGYNIYRSKSSKPKNWGDPINGDKLLTKTEFIDDQLEEATTYYYTITASDEVPNESELSKTISGTTLLGQHGPVIKNPQKDFIIHEDTIDDTTIDLLDWFSDPNGDVLNFECKGWIHLKVTIFEEIGKVKLEPETNWNGKEILLFLASDQNDFIQDEVMVTVIPVNDPPELAEIISPKDGYIANDTTIIQFEGSCSDLDLPDQDELSFTWRSNISGKLGSGEKFAKIINTPGYHLITLKVTDIGGEVSKAMINVTITKSIIPEPLEEPEDKKPKSEKEEDDNTFLIAIGIVGGILILVLVLILFSMLRRKPVGEKEEEEEDLEESEDEEAEEDIEDLEDLDEEDLEDLEDEDLEDMEVVDLEDDIDEELLVGDDEEVISDVEAGDEDLVGELEEMEDDSEIDELDEIINEVDAESDIDIELEEDSESSEEIELGESIEENPTETPLIDKKLKKQKRRKKLQRQKRRK
jgi:parallel beta-helix repeat protein